MSGESLTVELQSDAMIGGPSLRSASSVVPDRPSEVVLRRPTVPAVAPKVESKLAGRARGATVWALAGLLVLFLAVPVGALVVRALGAGEGWDAQTYEMLRQALGLSVVTTAMTMVVVIVLGTPLAYLLARRRFRGAAVVEALVDLPIVLPPAVAGIALLVAFGRNGLVGQWLAERGITLGFTTRPSVMAQVFVSAPFYVIAARGGFARVDQRHGSRRGRPRRDRRAGSFGP